MRISAPPLILTSVLVFARLSPAFAQQLPGTAVPCDVTSPNGIVAGETERQEESYGNALLSVGPFGLWPDGTVIFRPGGAGSVTTQPARANGVSAKR